MLKNILFKVRVKILKSQCMATGEHRDVRVIVTTLMYVTCRELPLGRM